MTLFERIRLDLDNRDFSRQSEYEHEVARTTAEYSKHGQKNYSAILTNLFDYYKQLSNEQSKKSDIHKPGNSQKGLGRGTMDNE